MNDAETGGLPKQPAKDQQVRDVLDDAAWADSVLKSVWGQNHKYDVATLVTESGKLLGAMRAFETATNGPCGYAAAVMAAVAVRYYGPDFVLESWSADVRGMAEAERDLYAAKQKGAA